MGTILDGALTSLAFCWRLERSDGVALGFTSHDRDLTIGGFVYRAAPGMAPSAIEIGDGFDADAMSIGGALSAGAITRADLIAGRWDGAAVRLFLADWSDPGGTPVALARGMLGDVRTTGRGFETELKGPAAMLERPAVEQTSPECRAALGDKRCRVDMAGRSRTTRIVALPGEDSVEVADAASGARAHAYGRLRWIGGANSGLESAILTSDGPLLRLREPPPLPAAVGDLVRILEGCDKSFATCRDRFANAANFRGEPHLPGIDLLTRYPGAS